MATELTKYNHNPNTVTEFKDHFFLFKTKKISAFIYGVVFVFIPVTLFLAFSHSSSTSTTTTWFINVLTVNYTYSPFNQSIKSPLPSDFPSNSTQISPFNSSEDTNYISKNMTNSQLFTDKVGIFEFNTTNYMIPEKQDKNFELVDLNKNTSLLQNPTKSSSYLSNQVDNIANLKPNSTNTTSISPEKQGNFSSFVLPKMPLQNSQSSQNATVDNVSSRGQEGKRVKENGGVLNFTASLSRKSESSSRNDTVSGEEKKKGKSMVGLLVGCDLYDGDWVRDDSYPLYKAGSCNLIDEQFNCKLNGRPDDDYQKFKWKPKGCMLPRLKGRRMLNLLKGKRLVFVGDSLNRNMWESLVCILKNSVKNPKNVYEAYGRRYFRNEVSFSFVFKDYNCTIEFFVAPFLVRPLEFKDKNGTTKETLRLDLVVEESDHFKDADVLIFNTGHWWTHEKTSKGEDYYQEGNNVYKQLDVIEAFRKAITTWGRWIDANINPHRTHVIFRGYSNTHFFGGQWNSGGQCDGETEPIRNATYLTEYPWKMKVLEEVINGMKIPISYLNITKMTDYRKDAHPSIYRKQHLSEEERKSPLRFQDCSHWCLPGVPDLWNELLYAEMLRKKYQDNQQKT